jgi:hypothetical protein
MDLSYFSPYQIQVQHLLVVKPYLLLELLGM